MSLVVQMTGTRSVAVAEEEDPLLGPNQVRLETWYSGISAGTELTTYRGSNPYLNKMWDPERRLFVDGGPTIDYPMSGWGYEEVGQVIAVGADVASPVVGDVVYGTWGHRSHAVVPVSAVAGHVLPPHVAALHGIFVRVGAIALNAVLAARHPPARAGRRLRSGRHRTTRHANGDAQRSHRDRRRHTADAARARDVDGSEGDRLRLASGRRGRRDPSPRPEGCRRRDRAQRQLSRAARGDPLGTPERPRRCCRLLSGRGHRLAPRARSSTSTRWSSSPVRSDPCRPRSRRAGTAIAWSVSSSS